MLILKNNLIASLSIITNFLKTKIESHSDEATYFYNKEIAKADFNPVSPKWVLSRVSTKKFHLVF